MLLTTKQAYVFHRYSVTGEGKDATHTVADTFKLPLTDTPMPAPDWIKETLLWKLAMRDGTIAEFGDKAAAPGGKA